MEFRYRAIDTDRPPPSTDTAPSQSPLPNSSFFPPPRSIPGSSEDDQVREAIQREIEKEHIRQEIIIAEAVRKRELIAEVLQEMAIEREMAKRRVAETGMSLEEKITMWINQRKLSNQNQNMNNLFSPMMYKGPYNGLVTSPMMQLPSLQPMHESTTTGTSVLESNKEKLIVLNRADTMGAKGKEDSVGTMHLPQLQRRPDATGTSVLDSNKDKLIVLARADPVGEKRKAEDTHQTGLNKHVKGKRHKAKVAAVLEAKTMSVETGEIVSSKKQVESKLRRSFKFWCDICKVGTFCQTVMRDHELGKKHKAAVTQRNEAPEAASTSLAPASCSAPQSETISGIETANVPAQVVEDMSMKETMGKKTEEGEKKKKVTIWCSTCNIHANSETTMRNHRLGKKHMALVEKEKREPVAVPMSAINAADPGEKESVSLAKDHTEGEGSLQGEGEGEGSLQCKGEGEGEGSLLGQVIEDSKFVRS
ncbi:PREDICTED: uncharacterized protein LOC104752031 isoform X2 [Camelina sativa]|uniref:Uncharacterized protein LOC104752031 isoform X2 n=1 Tax=Camelina sativa TaxID=90675 RepID=A0ABM0WKJ0_CAMSA|nr:PREDICTED: uncharacterized protein LOC104752031 isoform X2 [Camelina sativa]